MQLAGKFAGVVLVSVPDESFIALELSLANLAPSGLRVTIERGAAAEAERPRGPSGSTSSAASGQGSCAT